MSECGGEHQHHAEQEQGHGQDVLGGEDIGEGCGACVHTRFIARHLKFVTPRTRENPRRSGGLSRVAGQPWVR